MTPKIFTLHRRMMVLCAVCCFALSAFCQTFYVSKNGSNRADGTTPATAKKDIQAVLNYIRDHSLDGAQILVAEGNYLGAMDAGYIEVSNYVSIIGGYNPEFTCSDPRTYITRIEPGEAQRATNGRKGLVTISGLDDVLGTGKTGTLLISGFTFNYGYENFYMPADPGNPKNGCPSRAFETGRMLDDPSQIEHPIIKSEQAVAGDVIISNCVFANSPYFAIQINTRRGQIQIVNNVFVANRYGAVRVDGWSKDGTGSTVLFERNVVAFSWCRDRTMEDMGYGFECMTRVNCSVHHNIFACNNYAAIARTHVLSGPDKVIEAKRVTNFMENAFFMNPADLLLPAPGGGGWTKVQAAQFEDVDESIVPVCNGNFELTEESAFVKALDPDYLKAFASIKVFRKQQYDPASSSNRLREVFGLNKQANETNTVSMYGNRYSVEKALRLFGTIPQYGPQVP